jgi:adenosylcobyric acid synthase
MAALMVQGTSSWAGKSLLTTVLCRHFANGGLRVAPFKAQNMSNNARVVDGGEIGTAQYIQARAARVAPEVRMNPVLVKPETETSSQVVIRGRVDARLSELDWQARPPFLWPAIEESYRSLAKEFDLVVIEGAGSPAEINLKASDLANMRVARLAGAPVLLVADIDRGGALAHLYGTWALLDEADRARVSAFVLNRFRGDLSILEPAPRQLQALTGTPTLGVVPLLAHSLPDEDGAAPVGEGRAGPRVAIVRYPTASNLDEFKPLEDLGQVVWAQRVDELDGADLVILPGSKNVAGDLAWLRAAGLETALRRRAATGGRILGICGGLQMLGRRIAHAGPGDGDAAGLGLLAIDTDLLSTKRLAGRTEARFETLAEPWAELSGQTVVGYEIRHGRSSSQHAESALADDLGWIDGSVLGIYLHGAFENRQLQQAILGASSERTLDGVIEQLTSDVIAHLDMRLLDRLVSPASS